MKFLSTIVIFATLLFTVQAAWYENLGVLDYFQTIEENYIEYHDGYEQFVTPTFVNQGKTKSKSKKHSATSSTTTIKKTTTLSHHKIPDSSSSGGEGNNNKNNIVAGTMMMPLLTVLSIIFL